MTDIQDGSGTSGSRSVDTTFADMRLALISLGLFGLTAGMMVTHDGFTILMSYCTLFAGLWVMRYVSE